MVSYVIEQYASPVIEMAVFARRSMIALQKIYYGAMPIIFSDIAESLVIEQIYFHFLANQHYEKLFGSNPTFGCIVNAINACLVSGDEVLMNISFSSAKIIDGEAT